MRPCLAVCDYGLRHWSLAADLDNTLDHDLCSSASSPSLLIHSPRPTRFHRRFPLSSASGRPLCAPTLLTAAHCGGNCFHQPERFDRLHRATPKPSRHLISPQTHLQHFPTTHTQAPLPSSDLPILRADQLALSLLAASLQQLRYRRLQHQTPTLRRPLHRLYLRRN